MRLSHLSVSGFLGCASLDLALQQPVVLIAGHNAAGKSSIAEAVRFAMLAEPERVTLKRDYPMLINAGASSARIEMIDGDGESIVVSIASDGAIKDSSKGREVPPALGVCLDHHRFAVMTADERRSFLFGLMGISTDGAAVREKLIARGTDQARAEAVLPLLRTGFPAACDEAKSRARDAKAAWRTITGETYGDKKAAAWKAPKPDWSVTDLSALQREQFHVEEQLSADNRTLGELMQRQKDGAGRSQRIGELREKARRFAAIAEKLKHDQAELASWREKLAALPPTPGAPHEAPPTEACPCCGAHLVRRAGKLAEYVAPAPGVDPDPEIERQRTQAQEAAALLESAVRHDQRDLEAANAAAQALDELERQEAELPPAPEEIDALRTHIDATKDKRAGLSGHIDAMRDAERKASAAVERTTKAAAAHADACAWAAIADALAPDGIPAELLAGALDPINDRLAQSAEDAAWRLTRIDAEMGITYGGRPYRLCSESERWRADAMIGEAVAQLSGLRLLVLDRADVLDITSRVELFSWLSILADNGEIDTALVLATLKQLPVALPPGVQAHWIERGAMAQPALEAA